MVSSSSSTLLIINGGLMFSTPQSSISITPLKWGLRREQDSRGREGPAFRVLANPNVSPGARSKKEVIMVDPLEAKRLAVKQMEQIKSKEYLQRKREIEAINGAWAMMGLTAGLVIEGKTGNGILAQLGGYWAAIAHLFGR